MSAVLAISSLFCVEKCNSVSIALALPVPAIITNSILGMNGIKLDATLDKVSFNIFTPCFQFHAQQSILN